MGDGGGEWGGWRVWRGHGGQPREGDALATVGGIALAEFQELVHLLERSGKEPLPEQAADGKPWRLPQKYQDHWEAGVGYWERAPRGQHANF